MWEWEEGIVRISQSLLECDYRLIPALKEGCGGMFIPPNTVAVLFIYLREQRWLKLMAP